MPYKRIENQLKNFFGDECRALNLDVGSWSAGVWLFKFPENPCWELVFQQTKGLSFKCEGEEKVSPREMLRRLYVYHSLCGEHGSESTFSSRNNWTFRLFAVKEVVVDKRIIQLTEEEDKEVAGWIIEKAKLLMGEPFTAVRQTLAAAAEKQSFGDFAGEEDVLRKVKNDLALWYLANTGSADITESVSLSQEEVENALSSMQEQMDTPIGVLRKNDEESMERAFRDWLNSENVPRDSAGSYVSYLRAFKKNSTSGLDVFSVRDFAALESFRKTLIADGKIQKWKTEKISSYNHSISTLENYYQPFLSDYLNNLSYMDNRQISSSTEIKSYQLPSVNTILYGPPGTGKTYNTKRYAVATCGGTISDDADIKKQYKDLVEEGRIKFVTFHQSYGYEEFIQGIAAKVNEESRQVEYTTKDGVFVRFCKEAAKIENKDRNYIFIIDEINRGNISKIFGELITLIEDTKREGCDDAQSAELPHGGRFSVPKNVYILGTMNTADRSIALLDTALRRRFDFIEMMPSQTLLDGVTVDGINIQKLLNCMNERIEFLFDREHTIGHAFFMSLRKNPTAEKLKEIFRNKVIPLLQEYFYDDYQKIGLVLGSSFVKKAKAPDSLQKQNLGDVYRIADKDEWNFRAILTATDSEKSEDSESE